jgi:hypothetical protein
VIEGHTSMRFAWLRENSENADLVRQAYLHPLSLIRFAYNLVFWVFLLPFFTSMEYGMGFIIFSIMILIRLVLNLYTNNILKPTPERYDRFPFRIP